MGLKRVIFSGCLGMLCLIPMAWISFTFLDLGSAITGGVITNLGEALGTLSSMLSMLGPLGALIPILGGAAFGIILLMLFPLDWILIYRPDEPMMMLAVVLPWILCCTLTAAIFAHSPKGGLTTSVAIGLGYMIPTIVIYLLIPVILNMILGGVGFPIDLSFITELINDIFEGLTDRPFVLAVITAILEGCLIGGVFGAFIGSLKYKPGEEGEKVKSYAEPEFSTAEKGEVEKKAAIASTEATNFCMQCGAKLEPEDTFCTKCGAKA